MCFCTIDCQYSTLNRLFGCVLLVWRHHLRKVNKSSDALFLQFSYCLMFLNIQTDLIILKTFDQQFTLTTKKSLHIIFKDDLVGDCLRNSAPHIKCACRWQPVSKQSMHDLAGGETCVHITKKQSDFESPRWCHLVNTNKACWCSYASVKTILQTRIQIQTSQKSYWLFSAQKLLAPSQNFIKLH